MKFRGKNEHVFLNKLNTPHADLSALALIIPSAITFTPNGEQNHLVGLMVTNLKAQANEWYQVDDTRFAGKVIGSHYQFEDRLGLSMAFGVSLQQIASIAYMHYSNGELNSKNSGIVFLNMAYNFKKSKMRTPLYG